MKTSELTGAALDWAVAKADGYPDEDILVDCDYWNYSTDWRLGGSIIEREKIALFLNGNDEWAATDGIKNAVGDTPLIAAMRCYVASKLGEEVDLPVEIRGHEENCPAIDGFGCRCGEG
jgi:hypothetical protein